MGFIGTNESDDDGGGSGEDKGLMDGVSAVSVNFVGHNAAFVGGKEGNSRVPLVISEARGKFGVGGD